MRLQTKLRFALTYLVVFLLLILPSSALAQRQSGFSLLPCGTSANPRPCQFDDLVLVIVRVINLLLAISAIVAMYYILLAAWSMVSALGNPEKLTSAKNSLTNAVIGFAMILLSFAFVNLLVQGIFGLENCNWWSDPLELWRSGSCLIPG